MTRQEPVLQDKPVKLPVVRLVLPDEASQFPFKLVTLLDDAILGEQGHLPVSNNVIVDIVVRLPRDIILVPAYPQEFVQAQEVAGAENDPIDVGAAILFNGEWGHVILLTRRDQLPVELAADIPVDFLRTDATHFLLWNPEVLLDRLIVYEAVDKAGRNEEQYIGRTTSHERLENIPVDLLYAILIHDHEVRGIPVLYGLEVVKKRESELHAREFDGARQMPAAFTNGLLQLRHLFAVGIVKMQDNFNIRRATCVAQSKALFKFIEDH